MFRNHRMVMLIVILVMIMASACGASESTKIASAYTVVFGTPTEMDKFIVFDSRNGEGDQIRFTLDEQYAHKYTIDADLIIEDTEKGKFTVLLDTPTVRTVTFRGDKSVNVWSPVAPGSSTDPNTFSPSKEMHLRLIVDLIENSWSVLVTQDGQEVLMDYSGFLGATQVQSVRFTTSVLENPGPIKAMLSNVVISRYE